MLEAGGRVKQLCQSTTETGFIIPANCAFIELNLDSRHAFNSAHAANVYDPVGVHIY